MTTTLPPQIWLHLLAIVPAIVLGVIQIGMPKGTPANRAIGRVWVALMLAAAITSFWIQHEGFSWIHGLSILTIVSVIAGWVHARRGNRKAHIGWMTGAFAGSIAAGLGAFTPGRFLHGLIFGG